MNVAEISERHERQRHAAEIARLREALEAAEMQFMWLRALAGTVALKEYLDDCLAKIRTALRK